MSFWSSWLETTGNNIWSNFVPSANKSSSPRMSLGRSLISIINRIESSTLPCWTPLVTDSQLDNSESIPTHCLSFERNFLIQFDKFPLPSYFSNSYSFPWGNESNTLAKSGHTKSKSNCFPLCLLKHSS